ncbi:MAG TPA: glycosyltransferase [Burkholderiales bacterium]|nr:glycosyltransferase [Burkholderiales bacterium]
MMNIALYLKHFPAKGGPLKVGTNKAVHGMAMGLVANGARPTILCEGEQDSRFESEHGYRIQCFQTSARYRSFSVAPGLRDYVRDFKSGGLVVLNGMFHPGLFAVSRVLVENKVPYVVAPHGFYHPRLFKKNAYLKWPYWYLVERRLLKGAKAVQYLGKSQAKWSEKLGVNTLALEAPNGYAPTDVVPESQLEWRTQGPVRILYWGRLDVYMKGLDLLLKAYAALTKNTQAKLVIQGPDWRGEKGYLESLAGAMLNTGNVQILPPEFVKPPPLQMIQHDILCLPSRYEGFGLSALEAMLAGRVLLVSDSTGIAPHVEASGCGVVVEPTEEGVEEGLRSLIRRRAEWREMGLQGRRYVLERLNWDTIASELLTQYNQLLN